MQRVIKRNRLYLLIIAVILFIDVNYNVTQCNQISINAVCSKENVENDTIGEETLIAVPYYYSDNHTSVLQNRSVLEQKKACNRTIFTDLNFGMYLFVLQKLWKERYEVFTYIIAHVRKMICFIHDSDGKKGKKISIFYN